MSGDEGPPTRRRRNAPTTRTERDVAELPARWHSRMTSRPAPPPHDREERILVLLRQALALHLKLAELGVDMGPVPGDASAWDRIGSRIAAEIAKREGHGPVKCRP